MPRSKRSDNRRCILPPEQPEEPDEGAQRGAKKAVYGRRVAARDTEKQNAADKKAGSDKSGSDCDESASGKESPKSPAYSNPDEYPKFGAYEKTMLLDNLDDVLVCPRYDCLTEQQKNAFKSAAEDVVAPAYGLYMAQHIGGNGECLSAMHDHLGIAIYKTLKRTEAFGEQPSEEIRRLFHFFLETKANHLGMKLTPVSCVIE